jgi:hypothetical protein
MWKEERDREIEHLHGEAEDVLVIGEVDVRGDAVDARCVCMCV